MNVRGFTLIELLAVMLVVAVLTAVALPRMVNVGQSAQVASLQGMHAALNSATTMVSSFAALEGLTNQNAILPDGTRIRLNNGYPNARWGASVRRLVSLDNVPQSGARAECERDWCGRGNRNSIPGLDPALIGSSGHAALIYSRGYTFRDQCGVYYINPRDGSAPLTGLLTDGC
ncbi:Tfp pilus assembly protein FimT/FimU [Agaribacterium sp. ZY112]|uniref:pilus assembly FimT family protein n=1 Tax=Agaribacterium sp. ZY112 TaxID=3233574 RepID=UPI003524BF47